MKTNIAEAKPLYKFSDDWVCVSMGLLMKLERVREEFCFIQFVGCNLNLIVFNERR